MEDACGETKIVEVFKEVYKSLCNKSSTGQEMMGFKELTSSDISSTSSVHVQRISGDVVKAAAAKMKPGKSDVSMSYTSDAILYAPDCFFELLSQIFRSWLLHGTVTKSLLACAFIPLY